MGKLFPWNYCLIIIYYLRSIINLTLGYPLLSTNKMAEIEKIAILQSNYIPWKGYFDMINLVDEFIILDEVQYTRRDWRNRNKIKTQNGLLWILHCLTKKTLKWNGWIILDIKSISNSILLFSVESLYWIYFFGRGECKTIQEIF